MQPSHYLTTYRLINFLFLCCAIVAYAGFATNFNYDFLQPQFLWKAYNFYYLSIVDGRLDIPTETIGLEGNYIDGKTYMYYGALPLVIRFLAAPFVDLTTTPVSMLSVFVFSTLGVLALHISIQRRFEISMKGQFSPANLSVLFGLLMLIWFGSGSFIILQNSNLYHEPYAAAVCLFNLYLALLVKDQFFLDTERDYNLVPYALLAGLCIHARMPTALSLYVVTCTLLLICWYRNVRRSGELSANLSTLVNAVRFGFWPLAIMFVFGLSILILNYVKYQDVLQFMGSNYGYQFLEGFTERRCNVAPTSDWAPILRIVPNMLIYLTGKIDLYKELAFSWETGFGRIEDPVIPIVYIWSVSLLCALVVLFRGVRFIGQPVHRLPLVLFLTMSIGAMFQLAYPTIAHRYVVEFWPALCFVTIFVSFKLLEYYQTGATLSLPNGLKVSFILLVGLGVFWQLQFALTKRYFLEDGPIYLHHDYHYSPEQNAYLDQLDEQKIKAFKKQFALDKVAACEKYKRNN